MYKYMMKLFPLFLLFLFLVSPVEAEEKEAFTHSARSDIVVKPEVTSWKEIRERNESMLQKPNVLEVGEEREELPDWWLNLSPEDRKFIALKEYEDPMVILQAKKAHVLYKKQVEDALAKGEVPPPCPKPFDPKIGQEVFEAGSVPVFVPLSHDPQENEQNEGETARNSQDFEEDSAYDLPSPLEEEISADETRAPSWYSSFDGPSDSWRPSDVNLATGPAHIGVTVNSTISFYRKNGTAVPGSPVSLASWFPLAPFYGDLFDPKIVYDRWAGRWIILALNGRSSNSENYYALSVSQTANPEGGWWTWYLRSDIDGSTDTDQWTDYPGLGFDSGDATTSLTTGGGVYITSNQYDRSGSGGFDHGKLRVLYKYQLYNGSGVGWWDFWNSGVFTWKPAATDSSTGNPPTEYLINTSSGGGITLKLWRLTNPVNTSTGPSLSDTTISSSLYGVPPNAEQSGGGSSNYLDTGDCRTQDVHFRNGYVYVTAGDYSFWSDVFDTDAVVHYWKINVATNNADWDGYFGANDEYFFFGKIQADVSNNVHMVFSHASSSVFGRIGVIGRLATDSQVQSYNVVRTGTATYNPTGDSVERWGDYNGVYFDCAGDQSGSWAVSQIALSSGSWDTWVAGQSFGAPNVNHLSNGSSTTFSNPPRWYTWELNANEWSSVALNNYGGGDHDLYVSNTCPFGSSYAYSISGTGYNDFIVSNGTQFGDDYHHAKVTLYSGNIGCRLEVRSTAIDCSVGQAAWYTSFASSSIIRLFQVPLTSGKTYAAVVDWQSGVFDYAIRAFRGSRQHGSRSDNDGVVSASQSDGALVMTASENSTYGFVVSNENAGSGSFSFRVWLKPLISGITNDSVSGGEIYSGPVPAISEGTTPVTWSLDSGPAGMSINPSTGVVTWTSGEITTSYTVTIRATNPAGYDTESWTLNVIGAPGIVPDNDSVPGSALMLQKTGTSISMNWAQSCNISATDYVIHQGTLGAWYSHTAIQCSTGGLLNTTITPGSGNVYFIVVPTNASEDGGYGFDSSGIPRQRGFGTCGLSANTRDCP